MHSIFMSVVACVLAASAALAQTFPAAKPIVLARDFYNPDLPTCGIQEAINYLPKDGGQVILEPRTYVLRAPIVLRDDLRITGQGPQTLLTRGREIIYKLTEDAKPQAKTLTVEGTAGLRIGDEVGRFATRTGPAGT